MTDSALNRPHNYDVESIEAAFREVGLQQGDLLFLHVSLGRLGRCESRSSFSDIANLFIHCLEKQIGPTGTLLTPAFSYSIGRAEPFEPSHSPARVGEFGDLFLQQANRARSQDPMISVAGVGPLCAPLFRDPPPTCHGVDSFFHRFCNYGGKLLMLGLGLHACTFLHHIEELASSPFRFLKRFYGSIVEDGVARFLHWDYFAAPIDLDNCRTDGRRLDRELRQSGICKSAPLGRSEILCVLAEEFVQHGLRRSRQDPWFLAQGPPLHQDEIIEREERRLLFFSPDLARPEPGLAGLVRTLAFTRRWTVCPAIPAILG